MFTWFGPGIRRQSVSALRNSSSSSQPRCSTRTRCAQAERPPPKLARATVRKASASAMGVGRRAWSVMDELRVVWQLADVMGVEGERIRRLPVLRPVPVVVEQLLEPLDDGRRVHHRAQLAAQIEGAAVEIHRAHQRAHTVRDHQLRVHLGVLLAAHLHLVASEDAQRRKGVVRVPWAQAVLPAAQDADAHAAGLCRGQPVDHGGVHELGMLHVERVPGGGDEGRDDTARVVRAPRARRGFARGQRHAGPHTGPLSSSGVNDLRRQSASKASLIACTCTVFSVTRPWSRVSPKYFALRLKDAISARSSSTTIAFWCVTGKRGCDHSTATPACARCLKAASLARSPDDFWGFSRTRTVTLRRWASITAAMNRGSSSVNWTVRSERAGDASRSSTGLAPSSGWTISPRPGSS